MSQILTFLSHTLGFGSSVWLIEKLKHNTETIKMQQIIYFNSRDKLIRLDFAKIAYIEGDGNYSYIIMSNKVKVCVCMNLSHMEEHLATQLKEQSKRLMRIGKRFIVNMNYIFQIDIQKQVLMLSDFEHFVYQLPISKEALKTVKELVLITKI